MLTKVQRNSLDIARMLSLSGLPLKVGDILIFLTKRGDDPSNEFWLPVELDLLVSELDAVVRRGLGSDEGRLLLKSYLAMLRRHHLTNDRLEGLAAKLWAQHREALEYLMGQQPDAMGDMFRLLFDQRQAIAEAMSDAADIYVVPDDFTRNILRFGVPAWDNLPNFLNAQWTSTNRLVLLEVEKASSSVRIRFVLGKGDRQICEKIFEALTNSDVDLGSRRELSPEWKRLTTQSLKIPEDVDAGAILKTVKERIIAYAKANLQKYDNALQRLNPQPTFPAS